MKKYRVAILLATLSLACLSALAAYRSPISRIWGDEGTFLAMVSSLAEDGDLRFDERDLNRVRSADDGGTHIILQSVSLHPGERSVTYSKPVIYALVATPFYALAGANGLILLNALTLALALVFTFAYLRRLADASAAALVLVTFLCCSVLLPYVAWRMTDLFQAAVALIGLVLVFARERGCSPNQPTVIDRALVWPGAPLVGTVLLTTLAAMRMSNGVLATTPILLALFHRRWRAVATSTLTVLATAAALIGLTLALSGAANPYKAKRSSFTPDTGYPAGPEADKALERFEVMPSSDSTGFAPRSGVREIGYATFYFIFGRHTGLAFYFPAALLFLLFALRRNDRSGWAALLTLATVCLFFLVWRTDNTFGGDTFIGNRYFLSVYPLLLVALPRLPGTGWLAVAWALAALSYGSALVSVISHHQLDKSSQSHTRAGIFRLLPYETTARDIAGRRDRYWASHFVRFVDPFSDVGRWHAELYSGRPAAELVIAHWRPLQTIRLFVESSAPKATLEISDFGRRLVFPIGSAEGLAYGDRGVQIDLETSNPWRYHRYWWETVTPYWSRTLRLRLRTPEDQSATAVVRYYGDPKLLEKGFSYQRQHEVVPDRAVAGTRSKVIYKLRNTSPLTWASEAVAPIRAECRVIDEAGSRIWTSERFDLPRPIEPYQEFHLGCEVEWPDIPGSYRLEVDLVMETVAWFADRVDSPVSSRGVVVTARD